MLKRLYLLQAALLVAMTICGQNLEYKQIKATSGLKDGQDCFVTGERQTKLYDLVLSRDDRSDVVYDFKGTATYKEIDKLAANTQMFKVKLVEDKFYLYLPESNAFVSIVDNSISSNNVLQFMFALTADARSPITFETANGVTDVKVGSKFMRFHRTAYTYRLINKSSTDYLPIKFYVVQEKGEDPVLELNGNTDLTNTKFTGTIKFDRKFEVGYYNTLVLPFTIDDPWEVFGEGVEVYEGVSGTANEVGFKKLKKGDKMTGYKPYLIGGTWKEAPYYIKNVTLTYNSVGTRLKTTVGNQTLHSVFQKAQMGKTGNYVLYKDQLRSCKNVQSLYIEPYKWYLMTPNTKSSAAQCERIIFLNTDN